MTTDEAGLFWFVAIVLGSWLIAMFPEFVAGCAILAFIIWGIKQ